MRRRHPLLAFFAFLLAFVLLAYVLTGVVIFTVSGGDEGSFQYLLVLGNKVEGTEPSAMLKDRIDAAYAYLSQHPDVICVVSGYQSGAGEISEAECMFRQLTAMGIHPDRIWVEDQASSTEENIRFSLKLIEEKTGSRPETLGILSSEYHLLRAKLLARKEGISCVTVPAETTDTPAFIRAFLREIPLVWYYSIF